MHSNILLLFLFSATFVCVISQNQTQQIPTVLEMAKFCQMDSTCSDGYRLTICGLKGFHYSKCVESCKLGVTSFGIKRCSANYRGFACGKKLCYLERNTHRCQGVSQCPAEGYINNTVCTSCTTCQNGKCLIISDEPDTAGSTSCHTYKRCQYSREFYRANACPMGFENIESNCSCCLTNFKEYEKQIGHCLSAEQQIKDINQLIDYAINVDSYNTTEMPLSPECQKFSMFIFEIKYIISSFLLVVGCLLAQFA